MQFNTYISAYQRFKKIYTLANRPKSKMLELHEFYATAMVGVFDSFAAADKSTRLPHNFNHLIAERHWWKHGRPYYNFHPSLVPVFGRSKLNFPCSYIHFPFDALAVQFAEKDPNLILPDGEHYIKSCMVLRTNNVSTVKEIIGIDIDFPKSKYDNMDNRLALWIDIGEMVDVGLGEQEPIYTYRTLAWGDPNITVEQALEGLPSDPSLFQGVHVPQKMLHLVLSLVVSLSFLSQDDSPIIFPHVLKKDENTYHTTTDEAVKERLRKKAIDAREQIGFLVGSREMYDLGFVGPAVRQSHEASEREIQFAQIVTGHWHFYRYGPKKEMGRMRWTMPYVRGKDKPFKHPD